MAALRARWHAWWSARHPPTDTLELTQRNVYILPTRAGWMFALTLMALLVASINYQLSLGYVLTFLLAGSGLTSMHVTHATLRGLQLHLKPPAPVFAGDSAGIECVLASDTARPRYGIGLALRSDEGPLHWSWTDVPAGGQSLVQLGWTAPRRGLLALPGVVLESRFPLGLFRAWSEWRPAAQLLAYPRPETPAAPLPAAQAVAGSGSVLRSSQGGELEGVRGYRRGDPLKLVVWKKAARALDTGGELVSRDTSSVARRELWLDWADAAGLPVEDRLSRLAGWLLASERGGLAWGLRLPDGQALAPAHGESQRRSGLEMLARWP